MAAPVLDRLGMPVAAVAVVATGDRFGRRAISDGLALAATSPLVEAVPAPAD